MSSRPAVFLDRDGTVNVDVEYLSDPDELVLLPGAGAAIAALNRAGYDVVVITNQSGIARGMLDEERLTAIHARLVELLAREGAHVDAIRYCPHHPTEGRPPYRADCDCRKPLPGMIVSAARELSSDLSRSWVVGDSMRDLQAGAALGVPGILVATGKDERHRLGELVRPEPRFAEDLQAAVALILRESAAGSRPERT
jgi:D-glycero-D-manno-heptose 1,7-bisphosphate phosphatase